MLHLSSALCPGFVLRCIAIAATTLLATSVWAEDLIEREDEAIRAAVARVAPSIVRIETLGGLETVGEMLVGSGPTTGLVVADDGYIVSSAFNFIQKPSQIIVQLADGTRLPAEVVAKDNNRMLVLLKVSTDELDVAKQLPVPEAAPKDEMRVGAWAIAVGRVFEPDRPNLSIGILSALGRVWGKAIQTDAKISPANYGGPLVDIRGRVLGVLVPMSPQKNDELAGVEWYDSGIGFAVPLADINRVLDRMKNGEDLQPGLLGVSLRGGDPYTTEPVIAASRPKSPAAAAGLKAGDKIVEVDGVAVERQSQMRHQLAPRYAGETVEVVVVRGDERLKREIELVDKLPPYMHAFIGVLPRRDQPVAENDEQVDKDDQQATEPQGIIVRDVYAGSPAAEAGIKPGDKLLKLGDKSIVDRLNLQEQLAALEPRDEQKLEFERDGQRQTVSLKLATLPEAVPDALAQARSEELPAEEGGPALGKLPIKIPEAPNQCTAFVPETYRSANPHGLVIWLSESNDSEKDDEWIANWKALCEAHDLILLAPKSESSNGWQRSELEFVRKMADEIVRNYNVDPARVVAVGRRSGGAMAYLFAAANRDLLRGVAAIGAPLPPAMPTPVCEPTERLAFLSAFGPASPQVEQLMVAGIERLREAKHPVTIIELARAARDLDDDQRAKLARWIDTLDRS